MLVTATMIKNRKMIKKLLKSITTSRNYFIKDDMLCYKTKKYLYPRDIMDERDYTIICCYAPYDELTHALLLVKELKDERDTHLCRFMEEVISFVEYCTSILAYDYGTDDVNFTSRKLYDLPEQVKHKIYQHMKENVLSHKRGVGMDDEGNSYNSINFKPVELDMI